MSSRLEEVPSQARVFIDSTIFIYHFTAVSGACRALLERCEATDVRGVTSTAVLAEVAHRLMMSEALAAGLVTPGNIAKKLRAKPDVVRHLHLYAEQVERIPLMGIEILPLDLGTVVRSAESRRQHGLLINDSLVLASARKANVDGLASADTDFRRVRDLALYEPNDLV